MDDDVKGFTAELSLYIILGLEILISLVAPGMVFLFGASKVAPSLTSLLTFPAPFEKFGTALILTIAAIVGIILGKLGDLILAQIDNTADFSGKADEYFVEEYCSVHLGAHGASIAFQSLSDEEKKRVSALTPEKQKVYWDEFTERLRQNIKNDFQQKKNLGLSMVPIVVSQAQNTHQKRIRIYLSGPDSMFAFCRALLPTFLMAAFTIYFYASTPLARALAAILSLVICLLWINICIRSYSFLRGCQLSVWVGLGEQLSQRPILPERK